MANIKALSRGDVESFLAERPLGSRGQRAYLVALLDLSVGTAAPEVGAEALRDELGRRSGGTVSAAAFRKQLSRINDSLSAASAPFALVTRGSRIVVVPTEHWDRASQLDSVQRALVSHSGEKTRGDLDSFVPPRAVPDQLLVMWSYARLHEEQQAVQLEIFDRLKRKLAAPPPKYRHLPKIELWRDEERMGPGDPPGTTADDACGSAFLGLVVFSDRYPHSAACMKEAEHFLDSVGNPRADKRYIVLRFNCAMEEVDPRFARRLVYPAGDSGHLLEQWAKGDADDRNRLIGELAEAIFKQTEIWCRQPPSPPAPDGEAPSRRRSRIEQFMAEQPQRMLHDDAHSTPPLAKAGAAGYAAANTGASEEDGGIDIVEQLIGWASSKDPSRPRVTALLGDFGMGKTVTCQLVCRRMIERIEGGGGGLPTPVYFDLRDIPRPDRPDDVTLDKLFTDLLRKTGEAAPSAQEVIDFIRTRQALVIFDGLDEVTNKYSIDVARVIYRQLLSIVPAAVWAEDARRRRERLMGQGGKIEPRGGPSILLSCRSQYFADFAAERGFLSDADRSGLKMHEDIAIYTMLPFTAEQIRDYVERNLPEADRDRALTLIESTYDLAELARRPVLLKYIGELVHRLEAEKLAGRSINLARLYDILVRQAFERDAGKHVIPVSDKEKLLERLALHLHVRQQEEISNERMIEWLDAEIGSNFPKLAAARQGAEGLKLSEVFVQDLRNATLLSRPGEGGFRFGHTSLREYFLARALYRAATGGMSESWDVALPSHETLDFLLQRHAIEDPPERRAFEASFARLMRQGQPPAARWLAFQTWLRAFQRGTPLARPEMMDCSGFQLTRAELAGTADEMCPLDRTLWRGAVLDEATFEHADLSEADFDGVEATAARFADCRLEGAHFRGAKLAGSIWRYCHLDQRALEGADLTLSSAHGSSLGGLAWRPQMPPGAEARAWRLLKRDTVYQSSPFAVGRLEGRSVFGLLDERSIRVLDVETGVPRQHFDGPSRDSPLIAFGEVEGQPVWLCGGEQEIQVCDAVTGAQRFNVATVGREPVCITMTSWEGRPHIAWVDRSGVLQVWDPSARAIVYQQKMVDEGEQVALASGRGHLIVASTEDDEVIIIRNAMTKEVIQTINASEVTGLSFYLEDGAAWVVSQSDEKLSAWDIQTGRAAFTTALVDAWQSDIRLARWAEGLAVVASLQDVYAARPAHGRQVLRSLARSQHSFTHVIHATLGEEPVLISGAPAGVHVWSARTGACLRTLRGHTAAVQSVALGDLNGLRVLASGGDDGQVWLWNFDTGEPLRHWTADKGIRSIAFARFRGSPVIISGGTNGTVDVWDPQTGQPLRTLKTGKDSKAHDWVMSVAAAITADETVVAAGTIGGEIYLWKLSDSGCEGSLLSRGEHLVRSVALLSVGGRLVLAAASEGAGAGLWDAISGTQLRAFANAGVTAGCAGSWRDEAVIVSADDSNRVQIWSIEASKSLCQFDLDGAWINSVSLAEIDGRSAILTGHFDGSIQLVFLDGNGPQVWKMLQWGEVTAVVSRDANGDDRLLHAHPEAWKHSVASYRDEKGSFITSLDDMPRVPGRAG